MDLTIMKNSISLISVSENAQFSKIASPPFPLSICDREAEREEE
jgi:hypothetical protein